MQTFVQIADQGSLTRAADVLGSSLPAVVRSLAALEAHLGVRLFHRTTRRLSLTAEGRHYLPNARDVLQAADAADLALKAESRELAGVLAITAPVLFGHMYVAPALVRFMQRHTQIQCNVMLYDRTVDLLEEGIDVGIRIGELRDSSLVAQTLGSIRRVVVASPDFLARHGMPEHPCDLQDAPCVQGRVDLPTQWLFHGGDRTERVTLRSRLVFNQLAPAIEACAAGMGYGAFYSYQVLPHIAQGRLVRVLGDFEPPSTPIHVIYPHARLLPARTRALVDWMKMEFRSFSL